MRKIIVLALLLQFISCGVTKSNENIAILPFGSADYFIYESAPAQLNTEDYELIESLLIEYARENNNKNEYPYIKLNLKQCYRQYYPYISMSSNVKFVRVWLFENIPNNLNWQQRAINGIYGSYGDHFSVVINITEQSYRWGEFVPGRDISRLISSDSNRIIYTIEIAEEPIIYSTILNAINEEWRNIFTSWNISRNINLRDNVDIRRSARETAIYIKRNNSTIDDDLLESFIENNSQFYVFNETVNILQENIRWRWHISTNSRSESFVTFSRIGYNTNKTKSLVYIGCYFGGFAYGEYYILEKENGIWKIIDVLLSWIS
jgi:hypothetical protein